MAVRHGGAISAAAASMATGGAAGVRGEQCSFFCRGGKTRAGRGLALKAHRCTGLGRKAVGAWPWALNGGPRMATRQEVCARHKECRGSLLAVLGWGLAAKAWSQVAKSGWRCWLGDGGGTVLRQTCGVRTHASGDFCPRNVGSGATHGPHFVMSAGFVVAGLIGHVTVVLRDVGVTTRGSARSGMLSAPAPLVNVTSQRSNSRFSNGTCWWCILVHQTCSLHFGLDLIMELTRH
jgi:hypothetical protein